MMLLRLILTVPCLILTDYLYRFARNYISARRLSLPIVLSPFTWQNPIWVLLAANLQLRYLSHLPGFGWIRYSSLGWSLHDMYHSRVRHGSAFVIVSAGTNEIVVHDPRAIAEVLGKYKKWERPRDIYKVFSLLGENVDSVSSEEWPIHRRVLGAGFVEGNMHVVWHTAERQVDQWAREGTVNFRELAEAMDTISTNVLMRVGFGKDYDFEDKVVNDVMEGYKTSFAGAIQLLMSNLSFAWIIKNRQLPDWFNSKKTKEIRNAMTDIAAYYKDVLRNLKGELIAAMVDTNTIEKESGRRCLSEEELCGNLFMLQVAGSDTTSYAMSFTIATLSAHPDIQDWIREEIISGEYKEVFPRTLRCQAAVMETLRCHTPTPSLPRHSLKDEILRIAGQDYIIPAETLVSSNIASIHKDPGIWGDDAQVWKPQRWIEGVHGKETLSDRFEMMAWSSGPRICPGKKFSLVECAAVICAVLKKYRLEGTANVEKVLRDFEYTSTPKPKKPESASIRFVKI